MSKVAAAANQLGVPVDSLNAQIATIVAKSWGWRSSFFLYGGCGVVLAGIMALRLRPDRTSGEQEPVKHLIGGGLKAFFSCRTAWFLTLAFAGFQFSGHAFLMWGPAYLQDVFSLDSTRAAFDASFYPQVASIFGVMAGARFADSHVGSQPKSRIRVQAIGLALGGPFLVMVGGGKTLPVVCAAMAGYGLFKGIYDSNLFAAIYDVIDPRYRAMATSFMMMFSNIIASLSPWLLGVLKPAIGLSGGLMLMGGVLLVSSIPLIIAGRYTFLRVRIKA